MKDITTHETPLVCKYERTIGKNAYLLFRVGVTFALFLFHVSPQSWKISWCEFNSAGTDFGWKSSLCFPLILLIQLDKEFSI